MPDANPYDPPNAEIQLPEPETPKVGEKPENWQFGVIVFQTLFVVGIFILLTFTFVAIAFGVAPFLGIESWFISE